MDKRKENKFKILRSYDMGGVKKPLCSVNIKGFNRNNRHKSTYLHIELPRGPLSNSVEISIPTFNASGG